MKTHTRKDPIFRYMRIITIVLSLLVLNLHYGYSSECSEGSCSLDSDLDVINDKETSSYSQFEIRNLQRDLEFITTHGESPRNIKFSINSTDGITPNISINLPSFKKMNSGANALMIASGVGNISVNLSGRNGDNADRASRICAERILNGVYGPAIRSQFLSNRISNPSLPMNECTSTDIGNIQNGEFRCDPGFSEFDGSAIRGSRWRPRRVCKSESQRQMCVAKKVRISCTWLAEKIKTGNSCSQSEPAGSDGFDPKPRGPGYMGKQWVCDPSLAVDNLYNGWKMQFDPFVRDESWLVARRNMGMTDEAICDELTGRDTAYINSFSEIISNHYTQRGGTVTQKGGGRIIPNENSVIVKRGYYHGYASPSYIDNPFRQIPIPSTLISLGVTVKPCFVSGLNDGIPEFENLIFNRDNCDAGTIFQVFEREIVGWKCQNCFPEFNRGIRTNYGLAFIEKYCKPGSSLECDKCASNPGFVGKYIQCTGANSFRIREIRIHPNGLYDDFDKGSTLNRITEIGVGDYTFIKESLTYSGEKQFSGSRSGQGGVSIPSWHTRNFTYSGTSIFVERNSLGVGQRFGDLGYESYKQPFPTNKRGVSHLTVWPISVQCWVVNSNLVDCNHYSLGEAFGVSYFVKIRAYAPNGRIINYIIKWNIGRW